MWLGAAYYPEHRDPRRWEEDLDLMARAHLNLVRVGEFAWKRFEPHPGVYSFGWLDDFNEKAARRGIRLLLCPPLRTAPVWLVDLAPAVRIEREDGVKLEFGSRYSFCINHPLLLERGRQLTDVLAARYGRHPNVVGWHLDNELGDEPDCHCPICRAKFQEWCQAHYGAIENLNERWGLVFWGLELNRFEQVPTPRTTKTHHSPGHIQAWRRFRSDCTIHAQRVLGEAVRARARRDQFITTNAQTWNARTDYFAAARDLDVAGTNYYPPYGARLPEAAYGLALCRGYKQQPFQVHELRSGPHMVPGRADGNVPALGEIERLTVHTVAHGADAVIFFRWRQCPFGCEQTHGAITDPDGRPGRVYAEVARAFERLGACARQIVGTRVASEAGLLTDFASRWIIDCGSQEWNGPANLYLARWREVYGGLRDAGLNVDAVGLTQSDWSRYRLLVAPLMPCVDDALAQRLCDYVEAGGVLLWHPLSGNKTPDACLYPHRLHPRLEALFGVDLREFAAFDAAHRCAFAWEGREYPATLFADRATVTDGITRAEFTAGLEGPALVERGAGLGRALMLMGFPPRAFYTDFARGLIQRNNLRAILPGEPPVGVEVTERRGADGRRLIFLISALDRETSVSLPGEWRDVYLNETLRDGATLAPYGVRIVTPAG